MPDVARIAAEGLIGSTVSSDGKIGTIVEVNCETDFVGRNPDFKKLTQDVAEHISRQSPADVPALLEQPQERAAGAVRVSQAELVDGGA